MNPIRTLQTNAFLNNSEAVIVDVRTPAEYEIGHIPEAINLPLFSDEERVVVGTLYKQVGREEAIEKGLEFVGPKMAQLVRTAKKISGGHPLHLHCWRGGMRSGSVAWLLAMAGLDVSLLQGGYKAYRQSFEEWMEQPWQFIALGGHTGSGKTELLLQLQKQGNQVLDLEGLANHKGSAFGGIGQEPQPTTEMFINLLHQAMREFSPSLPILCETESMTIGRVFVPSAIFERLINAPCIRLNMPTEQRIERLMVEYGHFSPQLLKDAILRIQKRLGGNNVQEAIQAIDRGDIATAIRVALFYYDKGYTKSSAQHQGKMLATLDIDNNDLNKTLVQISDLIEPFTTTQYDAN